MSQGRQPALNLVSWPALGETRPEEGERTRGKERSLQDPVGPGSNRCVGQEIGLSHGVRSPAWSRKGRPVLARGATVAVAAAASARTTDLRWCPSNSTAWSIHFLRCNRPALSLRRRSFDSSSRRVPEPINLSSPAMATGLPARIASE